LPRVGDAEIIVLAGWDLVLPAHHAFDFDDRPLHGDAGGHLCADRVELVAAKHAVAGGVEGDPELLIHVAKATGAFCGQHADDLEGQCPEIDRLPDDGLAAAAEPCRHAAADYRHRWA